MTARPAACRDRAPLWIDGVPHLTCRCHWMLRLAVPDTIPAWLVEAEAEWLWSDTDD